MVNRRERKKLVTRTAILNSALSLFHEKGIITTRIEDITNRADVAKGAFYCYFTSKDDIVCQLILEGINLLKSDLHAAMNPKWQIEQRIEAAVRTHELFFTARPEYTALFQLARGLLETKLFANHQLQKGFILYLDSIAETVFPVTLRSGVDEETTLQYASILAGSLSGYRSLRQATGLRPDYSLVAKALTVGLLGS
ncbi:MAG: TetR/AcrR family transcriptional regulator [bacterium]|nr:TetR/AcrR family transcriptional regulator [bacterium]